MNEVYIHYNQSNHRGPGMVVKNLLEGLRKLDIIPTRQPSLAKHIGCLQHPGSLMTYFPSHTLMGPNIFVLPNEAPEIIQKFNNFIVPSQWIKDKYFTFPEMKNKNIDIWSVGINTEEWKDSKKENKTLDTFIYYKNRSEDLYKNICAKLNEKQINYKAIKYGHYTESQLKELCKLSKSCILLTDTESQGIAYMQILSSNVPCLVINKQKWEYKNHLGSYVFEGTSVPYFDSRCGEKFNDIFNFEEMLEMFFSGIKQNIFDPRSYVLENHTLEIAAKKYLEILKNANTSTK